MEFTKIDETFEESRALAKQAQELMTRKDVSAEDLAKGKQIYEAANELRERSKMLADLDALVAQSAPPRPEPQAKGGYSRMGDMLTSIYAAKFQAKYDPRLVMAGNDLGPHDGKAGWMVEKKDLVENTGATGGFLVFPEHRNELFMIDPLSQIVRQRAFVIPMRARVMQIPVLDQTGAPAAGSSYYGGAIAYWTEEATSKTESEPKFRQVELVAHKLAVYTEASDELLADSAIPLESLLQQLFRSVVVNEEEWTFINGTGAGQPLGIVTANTVAGLGPTIVVARTAANTINILDIFNMLSSFQGRSPIWIAHQNTLPQILGLNGPAGNPAYVWIGNGRDQMPTTLMGYPIFFVENAMPLGTQGDLILADLSKYVIGDRQMVTIDASKEYRFQYDLTSWRAVHRVDGRPWLSAPITYRDGATTVSPFVILDGAGAT